MKINNFVNKLFVEINFEEGGLDSIFVTSFIISVGLPVLYQGFVSDQISLFPKFVDIPEDSV